MFAMLTKEKYHLTEKALDRSHYLLMSFQILSILSKLEIGEKFQQSLKG